jgi:hypothetical protein
MLSCLQWNRVPASVFIGQVIFDGRHQIVIRAIVITSDEVIISLSCCVISAYLRTFEPAMLLLR